MAKLFWIFVLGAGLVGYALFGSSDLETFAPDRLTGTLRPAIEAGLAAVARHRGLSGLFAVQDLKKARS